MKQKIKDICEKGSSNLKQKELLSEGKYPVFGAGGLSGYLNTYHQEREYIGIVKDGSGIGRVDFYPAKTSLIGTMQYIIPLHGFNIRYIGYCLQSLDLSKHKQGAAIPHIYFRDYGEQEVNITPDIAEQEEIVSRLDKAFEQIETLRHNAEHSLTTAQQLFQSTLSNLLTPQPHWQRKTLGDIGMIVGGSTPKTNDPSNWNGTNLWVTPAELDGSMYFGETKRRISDKAASRLQLMPKGTVLLSSRAPIGKVAITTKPMYCNQGFKNIVCSKSINNIFIYWYILYSVPLLQALGIGATFKEISKTKVEAFPIIVPPLPEQTAIVAKLDSLSAKVKQLKDNYTRTVALCDQMKQALLEEVFE